MSDFVYRYVHNSNCCLPHRFVTGNAPHLEARAWAIEQFGEPAVYGIGETRTRMPAPRGRWTTFHNDTIFSFLDPTDALAFRMRWT